jgi:hypothetical protein
MTRRALLLLAFVGCATGRGPSGTLVIRANVPDALVLIDDRLGGRAAEWAPPGRLLEAGFHRVELRHPGHHSHYAEIDVKDGATVVVEAELRPLLD